MIYLDTAATTPVRREVLEAMWPILTADFGNPSSHHEIGEAAARALAAARASVAEHLGCRSSEVIFTSGGSEADNLAIKGIALANPRGRHILTSAIEHEAVLASCDYLSRHHGFEISFVDVAADGLLDPAEIARLLRPDTTLVSLMHANNEIGTVQPLGAIGELTRAAGVPLHTDAVQSARWLNIGLHTLGVDALSISGHKLGAPKGIGALAIRRSIALEPTLHGGGQERGRRSGTENVAGAVGLAVALDLAQKWTADHGRLAEITAARDILIEGILRDVPHSMLTGHATERLPNHASFCFPGTSGEAVLLELERRGVVCSSGSACAAGSDEPSHVLIAIGMDAALATTAVRFTLGTDTTTDEVHSVVGRVIDAVAALR